MFTADVETIKSVIDLSRASKPTVEITGRGRAFLSCLIEDRACVVVASEDMKSWDIPVAAVTVGDGERIDDCRLFLDNKGRLWLMWSVSPYAGVRYRICDDPDAAELLWGEEKTAPLGHMLARPISRDDGIEEFLSAVTLEEINAREGEGPERGAHDHRLNENGEFYPLCGKVFAEKIWFDSISLMRKPDGALIAYLRTPYGIAKFMYRKAQDTFGPETDSGYGAYDSKFHIGLLSTGHYLLVNRLHHGENGAPCMSGMLSLTNAVEFHGMTVFGGGSEGITRVDFVERDGYIHLVYDFERDGKKHIFFSRFTEADILADKLESEKGISVTI